MTDTITDARLTLPEEQTLAAIVSVLRQNDGEDYYVYERPPRWYLGLGRAALLEVAPDGRQAQTDSRHGSQTRALQGSLSDCARQFVAEHAADGQRVYGMAGFNYAAQVRGLSFSPGQWPLLSLMVARNELVFEQGSVTVRAEDARQCQRLCQQLQEITTSNSGAAAAVDIAQEGEDYQQRVNHALLEIAAGVYTKVIVSRALALSQPIDMPATLWRGRLANTPARSFLLRQGDREATGFSPEMVMTLEHGQVITEPLAGTRARPGPAQQNEHNRAELLNDSKEIVEHVISVKAAMDELHSLCEAGSVAVTDLMSVRERGSVQHLGSQVCGQLAAGRDAWDAFNVLFPAITSSGIPKTPALAAILRLEATPRELYSGAVLLLEGEQLFEAALVLRSVFQDRQRSWIQAGAGVIAQSRAQRELTETAEKLDSIAPHLVIRQESIKAGRAPAKESS